MKQILKLYLKKAIIVLVILDMLIGIAFLAYKNRQFLSLAIHNATTVQPESFTELYFQNNEHLPAKPSTIINYDAVPYTFSFSIHNEENKDVVYSYDVSISGQSNKILGKKTIVVKNGQTKTISEIFILPNTLLTRTKITVTLLNQNQQIFFWMEAHK